MPLALGNVDFQATACYMMNNILIFLKTFLKT